MTVAAEVVFEKSGICVGKRVHYLKSGLLLELRNFLIKGFYRQGSKGIWIINNFLGSSYVLSGNQNRYKV